MLLSAIKTHFQIFFDFLFPLNDTNSHCLSERSILMDAIPKRLICRIPNITQSNIFGINDKKNSHRKCSIYLFQAVMEV